MISNLRLFKLFNKIIYFLHLFRDVDTLRAMRNTMITTYTVVRLPFFGYRAVIPVQPPFGRHVVFGQHSVVMAEDRRYIESGRTWHAGVAGRTRDRVEVAYLVCQMHEQRVFVSCNRS